MTIEQIKQRLTMAEVIKHYGLKAEKQARLKCPFHNDKTPSLQLYYKTYPLRQVQFWAGHKYVSSTERYLLGVLEGLKQSVENFHPLRWYLLR